MFDQRQRKYIGNSIHIEANWQQKFEDRWYFGKPAHHNPFYIRLADASGIANISLIIEFIMIVNRDNKPIEMSCCFTSISISKLK